MSFVRIRRTHPSGGIPRKKKTVKKLPEWDDTVHDLNELKATPEEIARRKEAHKSKHALAAKLHKQRQIKAKKADLSLSNAEARKLAIMKEVLYDQHEFQRALAKSDKMMAVVKDLFGDDPRRMPGIPNITSAPNGDGTERDIVVPLREMRTKTDTLSESMVDQSALNDLESDSDEDDEDPNVYQPQFNLERFQQFLVMEEKNNTLSTISGQAQMSHLYQGPVQSTQIQADSLQTTQDFETPKKQINGSILKTPKSAMNDTNKIKKTKKCVAPSPQPQNTSTNMNLTDLRKVLEGLEDEIAEYERNTGRRPPAERPRQESFSGYTLSIVDSVTKLCRYLKENEIKLKAETLVREQLTQDVTQLAQLIDALTSDIILTQEEYSKLKSDFSRYKEETQSEILYLKTAVQNIHNANFPSAVQNFSHHSHQSSHGSHMSDEKTPPRHKSPTPQTNHCDNQDELPWLEKDSIPDHVQSESAAVLLSPPVRKTRIQREQEMLEKMGRQTSLVDLPTATQLDFQPETQQQHSYLNHPNVPTSVQNHSVQMVNQQWHQNNMLKQGQHPTSSFQQPQQGSQPMNMPQVRQGFAPPKMMPQNKPYPVSTIRSSGADARISVPRPSPLVQSNVGVSLSGGRPPSGQVPDKGQRNKDQLAQQISELNKQHEEAQKRLQNLMSQQSNQMAGNTNDNSQSVQHGLPAYPVSPPISPISQRSDGYLSLQGIVDQRLGGEPVPKRGITVSLPSVGYDESPH